MMKLWNIQLFAESTTQSADKALKEFFLPAVRTQLDEKSGPFLAMIEKTAEGVQGSKIKMAMKYGRSGGIGNRKENGLLPDASPRKWQHAEFGTKNIFGRIMLTDKLIRSSKSNKTAFVNQLTSQMEDLTKDANDSLRRQLFGDGSGVMAKCNANSGTTELAVDTTKFFYEGQIIDIVSKDGTVKVAAREIILKDKDAGYIEISGEPVSTLNTDIICIHGSYNEELTGLKKIFTPNNTIYGLDRSQYRFLNPNIKTLNKEIDEIAMQERIDEADQEMGSTIDFIMCDYGVARAYQKFQQTFKRNTEYQQLKGGYNVMSYNGIPLSREKYEDEGVMRFLQSSNFKLFRLSDWDWMSDDGAILHRMSGIAAYEATLVFYGDLGCDKPRAQSLLTGIAEH